MKKIFRVFSAFILFLSAFSSCKKAGTDGATTVVVFAKHHGNTIKNHVTYPDSVFIKFNATDLPSDPTHNYDALYVGEVGEDHTHCINLHTGKYYFYVTGMDSSGPYRVVGGMAIKIKYGDRKKEIDQDIAVTE
ncbi:MAG: hypothetical protein HY064_06015 [Bacteroidetes bacterium]|nr:hypothetical protein [Bacteroidota bacterium]